MKSKIPIWLTAKSSGVQSQLLTIKAIFLVGAVLMAVAFFILILFAVINKIKGSHKKAVATA